jgi:hypothetical protein
MSDDISIGSVQAGNAIIGGTGHTAESGTLNVYAGADTHIRQLRALIDELVTVTGQAPAPPAVRASAAEARAEAARSEPDTGRLRALMNKVCSGAGQLTTVTQAALNVIGVLGLIEAAVR